MKARRYTIYISIVLITISLNLLAQSPPAGIGSFDGVVTPRNVLWLRADAGVTQAGGKVSAWADQTTNGLNAVQADGALQPNYIAINANLNSLPSINFAPTGSSNLHLAIPDNDLLDGSPEMSFFLVIRSAGSGVQGILNKRVTLNNQQSYRLYRDGANFTADISNGGTASFGASDNTEYILSTVYDQNLSGNKFFFYRNSVTSANANVGATLPNNASDLFIGNFNLGDLRSFPGDIAEILIYRNALTAPQRVIVENYLGQKYAIGLTTNDIFGNLPTYDDSFFVDYRGIGTVNGTIKETEAVSNALTIRESNTTLNAGEFVAFAHDNTPHADNQTSEITVVPGILDSHWARSWYVEVGENGVADDGAVSADLVFDFGVAGLTYSGSLNNYVLLFRDDLTNDFERVFVENRALEGGNRVVMTVPASRFKSGYYTLGEGTQLIARTWYVFQDGNWADASTWTLDASTAPVFNNPGSDIPGTEDAVIIRSGRSVTVQGATNNIDINSIEVRGNLFLTTSTGHDFNIINGNGIINIQGNGAAENFPLGNTTATIGFSDPDNGGTLVINGSGDLALDNNRTLRNIIIDRENNADVAILAADYTLNGALTVRNGVLQFGDGTTTARSLTVEGDVLVENNGSTRIGSILTANANATHTFVMNGNFTNNGDVRFTNRVDFPTTADRYNPSNAYYTSDDPSRVEVSFTSGTQDQVVNCNNLTYFSRIVINKGADATYTLFLQTTDSTNFRLLGSANDNINADVSAPSDNNNAFALIKGTVKLDNNIIIPVLNRVTNYAIPSAARLWIDGGYVRKTVGTAIVPYGKIEISEGTLIADVNSGITTRENGSVKIDGGFVRLNQFRTSVDGVSAQGTYEQNGGEVLITAPGTNINQEYAQFSLTYSGTAFIMTGGTLTIRGRTGLHTSGLRGSVFINSDPGNQQVTGGTVIFESNTATEYRVTSRAPFFNVIMRAGIAGAGNIVLTGTTSGTGAGTETLAAQPLVVLNDLVIEGYNNGIITKAENPLGEFPVVFAPVTSDTNVNDVLIGGSLYVGRHSSYVPLFGGTAPYDNLASLPDTFNTTYFNQTIASSNVDTLYWGVTGVGENQLEMGSMVLDRAGGNTLRTIARTGNNGGIRFDINGNMTVQSGTLDQNAYTFRIWGATTNNDRLGTYFNSGPYPTASGTPSVAQVRFREDPPFIFEAGPTSIFGNVRLNVGAASIIELNNDIYFERVEYWNGRIYAKNHTVTIDEIWNINNGGGNYFNNDIANTSILRVGNTGVTGNILVFTDGNASDGGLKLKINGNTTTEDSISRVNNISPITFPVGFTNDGGTTFYSRPAQLKIKDFADDGYIQINAVRGELQTTDLSGGELLEHYWRVRHEGFSTLPKAAFRFYYRSADNGAEVDLPTGSTQEANYVPGYVLDGNPYTRYFESDPVEDNSDLVTSTYQAATRYITFNGTSTAGDFDQASFTGFDLINANFTAGLSTRFVGAPQIFYTKDLRNAATANWQDGTLWTFAPNDIDGNTVVDSYELHDSRQPNAGSWPGEGDIAVVGWVPWGDPNDTNGMPHGVEVRNFSAEFAELRFSQMLDAGGNPVPRNYYRNFQFRPTVCINPNGSLGGNIVSGEGMFWFRSEGGNKVDPDLSAVDFGQFVEEDSSYFVYETTSSAAVYNNIPSISPNLLIATDGWGNQDKDFTISTDIIVNKDFELLGDVNLMLSSGAEGDILVKNDLVIYRNNANGNDSGGGGEIAYPNSISRTIEVLGNLELTNQSAIIHVESPDNTVVAGELIINGDIYQDNISSGGLQLSTADDEDYIKLTLKGTGNNSYDVNSGNVASFHLIEMNKGTDTTSSFSFNSNFSVPDINNTNEPPFDLINGKLIFNHPSIDIVLANSSTGDFLLPNTTNDDASSGSGGLEIRQGTVRIEGDNTGMILDGKLTIGGGTLDMATGVGNGNNFIEYTASAQAEIDVTDGAMTIGSHIRRSTTSTSGVLKYSQTGGTVTVGRFAAPTTSRGLFEVLNTGSSFTLDIDPSAGHAFTIVRHVNSTTVPSLRISPQTVSISDNSVIAIGSGDTPSNQNNFGIYADVPLTKLSIASGNITGAKLYSVPLDVNELIITNGATFNANGFNVTINEALANNGSYTTSGTSGNNQNTIFPSNAASTVSGSGTTNFWNFTKQGSGTLTLAKEVTVNNNGFIYSGTLNTGSFAMNLKKDLLHDATHTSDPAGPGIIFNGTQKQNLDRSGSGTSIFSVVELNNASGLVIADNDENFQFDSKLILNTGVMDIGGNLVIFPVGALIENKAGGSSVSDFNINRMIQTNSSIRDFGVRKFYPATTGGNISFTYPVGLLAYTPVVMNITDVSAGQITVRPVADIPPIAEDAETTGTCSDPDIVDSDNVLRYYWILKSENISGFYGSAEMYYDANDVYVTTPYTVANYGPARLFNQSDTWDKVFTTAEFDEISQRITFPFDDSNNATLEGIYTAGVTLQNDGTTLLCGAAIPDQVPQFITLEQTASGDVYVDGSYQGGIAPNAGTSFDLIVKPGFTLVYDVNNIRTRKITLEAGATLEIASGTSNHNLGFVTGEGNLKLTSNSTFVLFPTGDYDTFFPDENCTMGGGLEYAGSGSYAVLAGLPRIRNVVFSGSGSRTFPNNHSLIVCEDLEVLGSVTLTVPDGNNSTTILGNIYKSDASNFSNGGGNSTIVMNGSVQQFIRGDFTDNDRFNNLTVNNPAGLSVINIADAVRGISANADVDVNGLLTFVNGLIRTDNNNSLRLRQSGSLAGFNSTRYVNGPFVRELANLTQVFDFPVGDGARYGFITIEDPDDGLTVKDWTVRYINGTPPLVFTLSAAATGAGVDKASSNEYWSINVNSTDAPTSNVGPHWTSASDVVSTIGNLKVLFLDADTGTEWDLLPTVSGPTGSPAEGYITAGPLSYSTKYVTFGTLNQDVTPLPVELVSFTGKEQEGQVVLRWQTASEQNNDYFLIEHSVDAKSFEVIGEVVGAGTVNTTQNYNFTHKNPVYPNNYYRLKQVDFDGAFEYSDVILVRMNGVFEAQSLDFNMYPNPTSGNVVNIKFNGIDLSQPLSIEVVSLNGRLMYQQAIEPADINNEMDIDFGYSISRGIYVVRLVQSGNSSVKKLVLK